VQDRAAQDWRANERSERAEDRKADVRRWRPTVPEQQLWSILSALGERYGTDFEREFKIRTPEGWYLTHVDYAWPSLGYVIEMYGGPHHKAFFDPRGNRQEEDAARIARIEAAGWTVLVVRDAEVTRERWRSTLVKVERFLARGRTRGKELK
jgi:very-short-patch-repair endonuclease